MLVKRFCLLLFLLFTVISVYGQWSSLNTGTIEYLNNVNFPALDTGYIVQQSGLIRKSVNGGQNWTVVNSNVSLLDFSFINVLTGFGIDINSTTLYRTNDGGVIWDTIYNETGMTLWKIYSQGQDFIYAIGGVTNPDSGLVISSYDGGLTWTRNSFQDGNWDILFGASFLSPALGYSNDLGSIYKTLDSGQTWLNLNVNPLMVGNSVYFISPDTGFSLSTVISRTTDGGISWTQVNTNGNNTAFYAMSFINDSVGYVVGGNGINIGPILQTIDGGVNWDLDTSSVQTFISIYQTNSGALYTSGTGGALWKMDLTSGLNGTAMIGEEVRLMYNFSVQQFILEGTRPNGKILIYDSVGKMIFETLSESDRSTIEMKPFSSGMYLIQYFENNYWKSFKGIKL